MQFTNLKLQLTWWRENLCCDWLKIIPVGYILKMPKSMWNILSKFYDVTKNWKIISWMNDPKYNACLKKLQIDQVVSHISIWFENIIFVQNKFVAVQSINPEVIWKNVKRMIQIEKLLKKQIDKKVSDQHHRLFSHSTFA